MLRTSQRLVNMKVLMFVLLSDSLPVYVLLILSPNPCCPCKYQVHWQVPEPQRIFGFQLGGLLEKDCHPAFFYRTGDE